MAHASGNEQWQDFPSTQTPVTAQTLENIETFLDDADIRINDSANSASQAQAAAQDAADSASAAQGAAENSATSADNANQIVQTITDNATPNPDPSTYVLRDAAGNARFATPLDPNDAANKAYVDAHSGGSVVDATPTVKGILQLAGDLAGSASAPTVPGLAGKAPLASTVNAQTGTTYTPVTGDNKALITFNNASGITLTLPSDANLAVPVGFEFTAVNQGAGALTLAAGSGATVQGSVLSLPQYGSYRVVKFAANTWVATAITRDATGAGKGLIQLAGDLAGTAASPTVPGLATKAPITNGISTVSGSTWTPQLTDQNNTIQINFATAVTVTLPSNATLAFPIGGEFTVINVNTGPVTFVAGSGATVNGANLVIPQWGLIRVVKTAGNVWNVEAAPSAAAAAPKPPAGTRVSLIPSDGTNTVALQATWLNRLPIWIPTAITITEVAIEVTNAAASPSTVLMGLYTIAAVGGAGTKLHDFGSVSGLTTGLKTLTGSWVVPAGLYEFVFLPPDNAPTVRAGSNYHGFAQILPPVGEVAPGKRYLSDAPQTTLPATSSASPSSNGNTGQGTVAAVRIQIS